MWLYIPCQSVREEAGSNLDWTSPALACLLRSVTWNGKSTRPASLRCASKKAPFILGLSGLTCEPFSLHRSAISWKESILGFSAGASPASPGLSPAGLVATMMRETYGASLLKSLARINRHSYLSRTYRASSTRLWGCEESDETWKEWVTTWRAACSRRRKLAQAIGGSGCSSSQNWATPEKAIADVAAIMPQHDVFYTAPNGKIRRRTKSGQDASMGLAREVAMWQTPQQPAGGGTSRSGERMDEPLLDGQARMWPTPKESQYKGGDQAREENRSGDRHAGHDLATSTETWPTPAATEVRQGYQDRTRGKKGSQESLTTVVLDSHSSLPAQQTSTPGGESSSDSQNLPPPSQQKGRLNANFVEMLMGWPIGFSDCGCSVTPAALNRWRSLSSACVRSYLTNVAHAGREDNSGE